MGNASSHSSSTEEISHDGEYCPRLVTIGNLHATLQIWPSPFVSDFEALEKTEYHLRATNTAPLTLTHPHRDRWSNPFTVDATRVHLSPSLCSASDSEPFDDYIAANLITEESQHLPPSVRPLSFIASQAPIPETFEHFWSMIWDQGTDIIFMLTKLEENGRVKAHPYWPSTHLEQLRFGSFVVSMPEHPETCSASGAEHRKLVLTRRASGSHEESRTVDFYQYQEWPDHSVPTDDRAAEVGHLIQTVIDRSLASDTKFAPPVIHCSAGAGRTGVFIAATLEYHRLLTLDPLPTDPSSIELHVFETVFRMRKQRRHMVQELSQYKFIFTVLHHLLLSNRPTWFSDSHQSEPNTKE